MHFCVLWCEWTIHFFLHSLTWKSYTLKDFSSKNETERAQNKLSVTFWYVTYHFTVSPEKKKTVKLNRITKSFLFVWFDAIIWANQWRYDWKQYTKYKTIEFMLTSFWSVWSGEPSQTDQPGWFPFGIHLVIACNVLS